MLKLKIRKGLCFEKAILSNQYVFKCEVEFWFSLQKIQYKKISFK